MSNNPKTIFPKEVIGFSVEALLNKHSTRSLINYQIILVALIAACAFLSFNNVVVNLNGMGVVQSKKFQSKIISGTTGRIKERNVQINQFVASGDTLFVLDKTFINNRRSDLHKRIDISEDEISDLKVLVSSDINSDLELMVLLS